MERLDDILNRSALRRSSYPQRTQSQRPQQQEEHPSQSQPTRRHQEESRANIQRNPYISQQSYTAKPQGMRRSSPPSRPEPMPPTQQPARHYGAGSQLQRSPLSPQRLADYGASTYRRSKQEEEEEEDARRGASQAYAVPSHTFYYHRPDDATPTIESDVLADNDILTNADVQITDDMQADDVFVEDDEEESAQSPYYESWEEDYDSRKQYNSTGQRIVDDTLPAYATSSYRADPVDADAYDATLTRPGFTSQRKPSSHNLRNVRPALNPAKSPTVLPESHTYDARTHYGSPRPPAALPEPRTGSRTHYGSQRPALPEPRPEARTHPGSPKPPAALSETRMYETRQVEAQPRARTTQPLRPQQDIGTMRPREIGRDLPTQERPRRPGTPSHPVQTQPRLPETEPFIAPTTKQPCQKCRGIGYLRANVPFGHPNFGKPIACECKEAERKAKRREQLREMSNLDAFEDSTFEAFNWRQPGVKEGFEAAYQYAQDPQGWLVLIGPNGCGKTHLAAAIANQRLEAGSVVLFAVVPDLLAHLRATFAPNAAEPYDQLFAKMCEAEVLVLDDLGAQQSSPWANEKLFQLLNYRYNMGFPTVITANPKGMQTVDERIRSRMSDIGLVEVINFHHAQDYRPHHGRRI